MTTLQEAATALAGARQVRETAEASFSLAQAELTSAAQAESEAMRVYNAVFAATVGPGDPVPEPDTFEGRKAAKLVAIRARSAAAKNAGIVVGGVPIGTTPSSLQDISAAVTAFSIDPEMASASFEAQPGVWVVIDKATMIAIGVAASRHIQACQANASALSAAVAAAADRAALDAIDITAGWPGAQGEPA